MPGMWCVDCVSFAPSRLLLSDALFLAVSAVIEVEVAWRHSFTEFSGAMEFRSQGGVRTRSLLIGIHYDKPKNRLLKVLTECYADVKNMKKFIKSQVSAFTCTTVLTNPVQRRTCYLNREDNRKMAPV